MAEEVLVIVGVVEVAVVDSGVVIVEEEGVDFEAETGVVVAAGSVVVEEGLVIAVVEEGLAVVGEVEASETEEGAGAGEVSFTLIALNYFRYFINLL